MQIAIEVDQPSNHFKQKEDGLNVNNMNWKYGGSQSVLHPTVIGEGCLGPWPNYTVTKKDGTTINCPRMNVGDIQRFDFVPGDPPPACCPDVPACDEIMNILAPRKAKKSHIAPNQAVEFALDDNDRILSASKIKETYENPDPDEPTRTTKTIEGYIGKPKGAMQVLVERGQ